MGHKSTEEANLKLVEQMYARVLGPLDAAPVDAFFKPDYIQHSPLAGTRAIRRKLGAKDRANAASIAVAIGLISPPSRAVQLVFGYGDPN